MGYGCFPLGGLPGLEASLQQGNKAHAIPTLNGYVTSIRCGQGFFCSEVSTSLVELLSLANFKRHKVMVGEDALASEARVLLSGAANITCLNARSERVTASPWWRQGRSENLVPPL